MIILVAALLLIGPDKLPDIARTIGKFIRMFNNAKDQMERSIKAEMFAGDEAKKPLSETRTNVAASLYDGSTDDEDEEEEEE
jgi:Sec-independent protein translocase protein TatA